MHQSEVETKTGSYVLPTPPLQINEDFSTMLKMHKQSYVQAYPYLVIGMTNRLQGWILHVSVIPQQVKSMLDELVPFLVKIGVAFKIPVNSMAADALLSGELGYHQFGKIITVYPADDETGRSIAQELITFTKGFRGPAIPTDVHLGGTVYTRYGSFQSVPSKGTAVQTEKFIYNRKGELVADKYAIPFIYPQGEPWPFGSISPIKLEKHPKVYKGCYVVVGRLKNDIKGKVLKGITIRNWWKLEIDYCLIKEANRDVNADTSGRDIRDRLRWQYEIQQLLTGKTAVPKPMDLFFRGDNTYMVTQFIEGRKLFEVIFNTYDGKNWASISPVQQEQLLTYAKQIAELVEVFHEHGIVHRDLNPDNFLIDAKGKVWIIDLELCYSLFQQKPLPPFVQGTPGFMSPEQMAVSVPTVKEDIFALGALTFFLLSGTSIRFSPLNIEGLPERVQFFVQNNALATLITDCLQNDPERRPTLHELKKGMEQYKHDWRASVQMKDGVSESFRKSVSRDQCLEIIDLALNALKTPLLTGRDRVWFSKAIQAQKLVANEVKEFAYYSGLQEGIAGVLLVLSEIKKAGFDIPFLHKEIATNWKYIQTQFLATAVSLPLGLFSGMAGVAYMVAGGLNSGLISRKDKPDLKICFNKPAPDLSLANGIAGQGLAGLACSAYMEKRVSAELLSFTVNTIISNQQADGSWLFPDPTVSGDTRRLYNLAYGSAGVLLFLMEYYRQFPEERIRQSAMKGLAFLESKAISKKNTLLWTTGEGSSVVDPWICFGYGGVILPFIKSYEVFAEVAHRELAERALWSYPKYINSRNLALGTGVAGLGHLYLEASRVFKNEQWQERADWIAAWLVYSSILQADGSVYWLTDHTSVATADFMVGCSGVIHYLARYCDPARISFPLLY